MCDKSGGDVIQSNLGSQSNAGTYAFTQAAPTMWDGGGHAGHGHGHGHHKHHRGRHGHAQPMAFAPVNQSLSQGNWGFGGAGGTDNNIYANTIVMM